MIAVTLPGTLSISIDLATSNASPGTDADASRESTVEQLLELCKRHGVAATWAVGDPAGSPLAHQVRKQCAGHEIAMLADPAWSRLDVPRRALVGPLTQAAAACRDRGKPLRSLVMRSGRLDCHWDMLTKNGLTTVRVTDPSRPATRGFSPLERWRLGHGAAAQQPHLLRWGLWEFPVTLALSPADASLAARIINRLATMGGFALMAVDAGGEPRHRRATCDALKRVMQLIAAPLAEGRLQVATMGEIVDRRLRPGPTVSSESILRRAA